LSHVVYKSIECLDHINTMHMSNVILKRAKPSSKDANTKGLNTHERRF